MILIDAALFFVGLAIGEAVSVPVATTILIVGLLAVAWL